MRKLTRRLARVLMGGLIAALAALPSARCEESGELTVMTSVALTSALDALKPNVERQDNLKLAITYGLIADLKKRVLAG
jgi:molybdate transport system substrate-binding protein